MVYSFARLKECDELHGAAPVESGMVQFERAVAPEEHLFRDARRDPSSSLITAGLTPLSCLTLL